jgi:PTH1 family peptidyl-tRNA hydrolase
MVIVGLGNPGLKYEQTRHNVGFMFVDRLAENFKATFVLDKQKEAYIAEIYIDGKKHLLVKPVTYMNNSGNAVNKVLNYWNIDPSELIVVYDDMDLEVGKIRIRKFGSAGGHNGMKSIIAHIQTQDFKRIRIGIGRSFDNIEHVLGKFKPSERPLIEEAISMAPTLMFDYLAKGVDFLMNRYN